MPVLSILYDNFLEHISKSPLNFQQDFFNRFFNLLFGDTFTVIQKPEEKSEGKSDGKSKPKHWFLQGTKYLTTKELWDKDYSASGAYVSGGYWENYSAPYPEKFEFLNSLGLVGYRNRKREPKSIVKNSFIYIERRKSPPQHRLELEGSTEQFAAVPALLFCGYKKESVEKILSEAKQLSLLQECIRAFEETILWNLYQQSLPKLSLSSSILTPSTHFMATLPASTSTMASSIPSTTPISTLAVITSTPISSSTATPVIPETPTFDDFKKDFYAKEEKLRQEAIQKTRKLKLYSQALSACELLIQEARKKIGKLRNPWISLHSPNSRMKKINLCEKVLARAEEQIRSPAANEFSDFLQKKTLQFETNERNLLDGFWVKFFARYAWSIDGQDISILDALGHNRVWVDDENTPIKPRYKTDEELREVNSSKEFLEYLDSKYYSHRNYKDPRDPKNHPTEDQNGLYPTLKSS